MLSYCTRSTFLLPSSPPLPCSNYVVQYVLDLGLPWATSEIVHRLAGHMPQLSGQKFSSNVVEKCLKLSTDDVRRRIVTELVASPQLGQLMQDPFANYVIQSALSVSKVGWGGDGEGGSSGNGVSWSALAGACLVTT